MNKEELRALRHHLNRAVLRLGKAGRSALAAIRPRPRWRALPSGRVERVDARGISGWARGPSPSTPAQVVLRVDGEPILNTSAAQVRRVSEMSARATQCGFRFPLRRVWPHIPRHARITVEADGEQLPFPDQALEHTAPARETEPPTIHALLADGYVINKKGRLQPRATDNARWPEQIAPKYEQIRAFVREHLGYETFAFYGVLLGYAREGQVLNHDLDLDLAYLSAENDPRRVRREFFALCREAVRRFDEARVFSYKLQFPGFAISITPCWLGERGLDATFGFVGDAPAVNREDFEPYREVPFFGTTLALPRHPQAVAHYLYGPGWAYPDIGWEWKRRWKNRQSTRRARLSEAEVEHLNRESAAEP